VIEGELKCEHCGRKYPIQQGIPNMRLNEDEVRHSAIREREWQLRQRSRADLIRVRLLSVCAGAMILRRPSFSPPLLLVSLRMNSLLVLTLLLALSNSGRGVLCSRRSWAAWVAKPLVVRLPPPRCAQSVSRVSFASSSASQARIEFHREREV
jgi:hypothetical protein